MRYTIILVRRLKSCFAEFGVLGRYKYIVTVALVTLALLLRLLLHTFLEERSAFLLFAPAVMASAWYGGLGSGLLATLLGDLLGGYFFLRPFENREGENLADALELILFSSIGVGISWMAEQLRIARRAAENRERETKAAHQQITGILESVSDGFQALNSEFRFVYLNSTAERLLGESRAALQGKCVFDRFPELFGRDLESQFRAAVLNGGTVQFEHYFEPWQRWFELNLYPSRTGGLSVYFSDITQLKNAGRQRERPTSKLEDSLAPVKALSGLLPICASCKKIRDDHGTWRQIEVYIQEHSSAEFTHSVCPDCIERLYPEVAHPS